MVDIFISALRGIFDFIKNINVKLDKIFFKALTEIIPDKCRMRSDYDIAATKNEMVQLSTFQENENHVENKMFC